MIVIGVGSNSRATADDVLAAIRAAEAKAGVRCDLVAAAGRGLLEQPRGGYNRKQGAIPPPLRGRIGRREPQPSARGIPPLLSSPARGKESPGPSGLSQTDSDWLDAVIAWAADELGRPLAFLAGADLAARSAECATMSRASLAAYGVPSVAEGAALAGAGEGSRLLVPRLVCGNVTAAVAVSKDHPS